MSYSYLNFSNYKNRIKQFQPQHVFQQININENLNTNNCTNNKKNFIQEKLIQFEMQRPIEFGESCPVYNNNNNRNSQRYRNLVTTSNLYKSKEYDLNYDYNNNNNNNDENFINFNLYKADPFDRTVSFLSGKIYLLYSDDVF